MPLLSLGGGACTGLAPCKYAPGATEFISHIVLTICNQCRYWHILLPDFDQKVPETHLVFQVYVTTRLC